MSAHTDKLAASGATGQVASRARPESAGDQSPFYGLERLGKFALQSCEGALYPAGPANQDMIGAGDGASCQDFACHGAQTALHSVARNSVPDLLGNSVADARREIAVSTISNQQNKSGHWRASATVRCDKICATSQHPSFTCGDLQVGRPGAHLEIAQADSL